MRDTPTELEVAIGHDDPTACRRRSRATKLAVPWMVLSLAAWLASVHVFGTPDGQQLVIGGILGATAWIATRHSLTLRSGSEINTVVVPLAATAALAPPVAAAIAIVEAFAPGHQSWQSRALNTSALVGPAVLAALAVGFSGTESLLVHGVLACAVFNLAHLVVNATFAVSLGLQSIRECLGEAGGTLVATTALNGPLIAMVLVAEHRWGTFGLTALLLPMAAAQYFHSLYHRKVQLTDELAEKAQVLARTNLQFAAAMVKALDARDAYTAGHSAAVAVYTRDIAREMGFDDETVRMAHLSGLLHDIGKIGVPGRVLNKTAPLDDDEYELMKSHAAMGASILGEVDLYKDIAVLVRYHHERIDGRGYPDGIAGEAIPAISRMISVADTYSAMTTDRPYRDGMPTEKAMSILRECRGTQLDKDFTDAFLRILIVADHAYQRGKQTDFEVEVAKHQALSEVEAEAVRIHAPAPAGPDPAEPLIPAAVDGELVEIELEREAA